MGDDALSVASSASFEPFMELFAHEQTPAYSEYYILLILLFMFLLHCQLWLSLDHLFLVCFLLNLPDVSKAEGALSLWAYEVIFP